MYVDPQPVPDLNRYDLGFLQVPEGFDAAIVARTLSTSEAILCAAPSYIARHGAPSTPQALAEHLCVLRRTPHLHRNSFALWRSQQSTLEAPVHEIEVRPSITLNPTASILQTVLDGAGIATFTYDAARPFRARHAGTGAARLDHRPHARAGRAAQPQALATAHPGISGLCVCRPQGREN